MIYTLFLLASVVAAESEHPERELVEAEGRGRELFPMLISSKCARLCSANHQRAAVNDNGAKTNPMMALGDATKGPV